VIGAACLMLAATAVAEQSAQQPTFAASVEAVYLDVFVAHAGEVVGGLRASDFEVRDQGVRQTVRLAQHEELPLTAVLVFDASASVRGANLAHLQAAGRALLAGLRERDEAALVAFSHELAAVVPQGTGRAAVRQALDAIEANGATAVWDGLYAGLKLPRTRGRSLVALFTDGEDNMSWLSAEQVQRVAEESNAVVHVVTLADPPGMAEPLSRRELRHVTEATGGRLWTVGASADLESTFLRILSEMQSSYLLTFEPTGVSGEGWHRIEVKLKGRRGNVRSRRGYFVPSRSAR